MDRTSEATGNGKPQAGCISMCLGCGAVKVFNADLTLRDPTPEEKLEIDKHPVLLHAQIARAYVVGDNIKRRHRETRIHKRQQKLPRG
jgi:hypothetical protein